ncbi:MAG: RNA 2',3'-cyclic phosphodiesterase [Gammaproteobacteria bacterium]|nr:RNA 2',3'-cyclic phosphodiesterase [Gammaproteobacteria bacterium]MDH4255254.1 RNA 2',3'-cyclic phosphodiesterase [Gammaproteobacteria bacterium]MDH5311266.1 RNA 2',3'-cyclic phosphodiesterase [Gammaproteobacteria bacterium]
MADRRLFFALWPDERQREQLRSATNPATRLIEGDAVYRGNWHVTLVFIGPFPEARIPELQMAASTITVEPFRLRFDRVAYWQRPRIACLQSASVPPALDALVGDLNGLLRRFDLEPEEGVYRPHVTLARRARAFEPVVLARPLELEWSGFELVESVSGPGGVQYHALKQELPRHS